MGPRAVNFADLQAWLANNAVSLLAALTALYLALANRRLRAAQVGQTDAQTKHSDASAAAEVSAAALALVAPLNDQISQLNAKADQMEAVNADLELRMAKQESELVILRRLADTQGAQIEELETSEQTLTAQNKSQAGQIAGLEARLSESENEARGLKLGVGVLINQLERAGIPPEYHPNSTSAAGPLQVEVVNTTPVPVNITPRAPS